MLGYGDRSRALFFRLLRFTLFLGLPCFVLLLDKVINIIPFNNFIIKRDQLLHLCELFLHFIIIVAIVDLALKFIGFGVNLFP